MSAIRQVGGAQFIGAHIEIEFPKTNHALFDTVDLLVGIGSDSVATRHLQIVENANGFSCTLSNPYTLVGTDGSWMHVVPIDPSMDSVSAACANELKELTPTTPIEQSLAELSSIPSDFVASHSNDSGFTGYLFSDSISLGSGTGPNQLQVAKQLIDNGDTTAYPDSLPPKEIVAKLSWSTIQALLSDSVPRFVKVDSTLNNDNYWHGVKGAFMDEKLQPYRLNWVPFESHDLYPQLPTTYYLGYSRGYSLQDIRQGGGYAMLSFVTEFCSLHYNYLMQKNEQGVYAVVDYWPKRPACVMD